MSPVVAFDPYALQRAMRWRNRLAHWRASPQQSLFHAGALLLFGALLWPLLQAARVQAHALLPPLVARAPYAAAIALGALAVAIQAASHAREARRAASDWLRPQPIEPLVRARRGRRSRARAGAALALLGAALLHAGAAPWPAWALLAATLALAPWVARPLSVRLARTRQRRAELRARLRDPSPGRLWRWQRIEAAVALRGRPLALGAWALLLVPMASGPATVLAVAGAGLCLAMLGTAWSRSLRVLFHASAWLRTQPMSGTALLRAACGLPALLLALGTVLPGVLLLALGAPLLAAGVALALVVSGSMHFAACFAARHRPRRAAALLLLHLALCAAWLQTLPPLLLLAWPLQSYWLLRQGMRQ